MKPEVAGGTKGAYEVCDYCELIHTETAEALAVYQNDFYAGRPALTVNGFGKGKAYYIAARTENSFLDDFYRELIGRHRLLRALECDLPLGVTAQRSVTRRAAVDSVAAAEALGGVRAFYAGDAFVAAAARRGIPGTYLGEDVVAAAGILEVGLAGGAGVGS
jgi:beta-galactosidase GanA